MLLFLFEGYRPFCNHAVLSGSKHFIGVIAHHDHRILARLDQLRQKFLQITGIVKALAEPVAAVHLSPGIVSCKRTVDILDILIQIMLDL